MANKSMGGKIAVISIVLISGIFLMLDDAEAGFYSPIITGDLKVNSSLTISIKNDSQATQPRVFYRPINSSAWNSCTLSFYSPSEMNCPLPAESLSIQGVYEYYFNSTENRFPEGNARLKLALSKRNESYASFGGDFGRNYSESLDSCNPWSGNFSCGYETIQSAMIESYWTASRAANNSTYQDMAYQFTLGNYDILGMYGTCNRVSDPFDCFNVNGNDACKDDIACNESIPRASIRQSSLISGLWTAVQYGANQSVKELAENYTLGSAEDCDVWNSTFNCTNPDSQGMMAFAYWKAYEMTGNGTFFGIAKNLTDYGILFNENSPYLARGMWKAYEMTGNGTYMEEADNLTREGEISRCLGGSCGAINLSLNVQALLEAYRVSGNYAYYNYARIHSIENSTNCNAFAGDYSCSDPKEQGNAMIQHYLSYLYLPEKNASLHLPQIMPAPKASNNVTISIHMDGSITSPVMYLRRTNTSLWHNCSISLFDRSCTFNSQDTGVQTSYEYYIDSQEMRFPKDMGTLNFVLSERNETYYENAKNLTIANSLALECSAWGTTPDYVCDDEQTQANMIDAFWSAYHITGNNTYLEKAYLFSLENYSAFPDEPECDHSKNDFNCTYALTQSSLVSSLWTAVQYGANQSVKELAENYTLGSAEDCDVWNSTFNCTNSDSQGMMALAYWKAYEMTGNGTFFGIAKNITDYGVLFNENSPYLARGMWKAYEMTGNGTYMEKADNLTREGEINKCLGGSCGAINLSLNVQALLEAYRVGGDKEYANLSEKAILSPLNPSSSCDVWSDNYVCANAGEQGAMISLFWNAYHAIPVEVKSSLMLLVSKETPDVGEYFDATCTVENLMVQGSGLHNVNLTLFAAEGLEISGNSSSFFSEIPNLESRNTTWSVHAISSGAATLRCDVTTDNGWQASAEKIVSITAPAVQQSSEGSGGGWGMINLSVTANKTTIIPSNTIPLNNTAIEKNDTLPPKIEFIYPANEEILHSLNMNALISYSDESEVLCTGQIDGAIISITQKNETHIFFEVRGIKNGTHNLFIRCIDNYNNSAERSITFYVDLSKPRENNLSAYLFILFIIAAILAYRVRKQFAESDLFKALMQSRMDRLISKAEKSLIAEDIESFSKHCSEIRKEYGRARFQDSYISGKSHIFGAEVKVYLLLKMSKRIMASIDRSRAEKIMADVEKIYGKLMLEYIDAGMKAKLTAAYDEIKKEYALSKKSIASDNPLMP